MNKIDKLVAKNERLRRQLDLVSHELKLLHIEFAYLREMHDLKKKILN
jgi:hypothetical protein